MHQQLGAFLYLQGPQSSNTITYEENTQVCVNVDSGDNVGDWGYEINVFSHFGPDLSSPGLTLVPTGIIKPRNLLKKLSKRERRQTNGYRMRFIVNFIQRIAM